MLNRTGTSHIIFKNYDLNIKGVILPVTENKQYTSIQAALSLFEKQKKQISTFCPIHSFSKGLV